MDREERRRRWQEREEDWRAAKTEYERRQTLGRQLEIAWAAVAREYYLADPGLESPQQPRREVFAHLQGLLAESEQLQHIDEIRLASHEAYHSAENEATREHRAAECRVCDLVLCCDDVDWWSANALGAMQWDRSVFPWMSEPSDPVEHVKAYVRDYEWGRAGHSEAAAEDWSEEGSTQVSSRPSYVRRRSP